MTAGSLLRVPSSDPLHPEAWHIELHCAAPPCMRAECVGTVELTVATNGVDFTGGTPPLLFAFSREFPLHVWGCAPPTVDVSNASQYYAPPGGAPCDGAILQRVKTLTGEQHALAVTRQAQRATLLGDARPAGRGNGAFCGGEGGSGEPIVGDCAG